MLLSGKNDEFHSFIEMKKSEWEMGTDMTADAIATEAITKYNNLVAQNKWKNQDRKDSKVAALYTEIDNLKCVLATMTSQKSSGTSNSQSNNGDDKNNTNKRNSFRQVAEWRKKKSFGASTEKEGKIWWWCPKHEGKGYKGLYVTHKPEDHDEHMAKFKTSGQRSSSSSSSSSIKGNLYMKDSLRSSMVTKLGMSAADAEQFWSEVSEN